MYYAAIFNMAVLGEYTNLNMLFPDAYNKTVNKNSSKFKIDKDLILSIMRKESLFDVEAGSGAGAKGLMQVTGPTGKFIAKKYKISLYGDPKKGINSQIYIPENNIALGTANLDFSIGLFKGNKALGIGAYNAGPGNVAKWLNKNEIPTAQWIESIPYGETRHYIRKVMTYMIIYNNFVFDDKDQKISDYLKGTVSNKLSFR
jgi:soluble lytic murein transglycosylase